ncbi:major facilitator superfamily domain-containing protein [Lactarius quietus]|nr:major facilitator superfamily domain-containing protein [Lactarius quietus]
MAEKTHPSSKEDNINVVPSFRGDENAPTGPIDAKILRRATLKIDCYLIPIVGMFLSTAAIPHLRMFKQSRNSLQDRTNIGNARIAGLTNSLHMSTKQFSIALTITYVPYILMEIPMNLLMKRLGANVTLPVMVILWGVVCACQGAVDSYRGLLICRFFLGALEGGLFPGIALLLSNFYKRHAMHFRFAMMYSLARLLVPSLVSLLMEFGTSMATRNCWLAVDLHCGSPSISSFVISSDYSINLLTEEEREAYCRDLADDWSGDADTDGTYREVFSWSEVASVFGDAPHVLMLFVPLFFRRHNGEIFGLANLYSFLPISPLTLTHLTRSTPTIVNALGHSPNYTQLLTVPPYACSFVFSIVSAYFCDKYKNRSVMATVCALIAAAGYAIFLSSDNKNTNYGALYLQIIGSYAAAPCLSTWNANNVQPHYRRATAIAISSIGTNAGGILSTWLFTDPPRFQKATRINLTFSLGMAACSVGMLVYFRFRNAEKQREVQRLLRMHGDGTGVGGWDSSAERKRLGDRHPRFAFTM